MEKVMNSRSVSEKAHQIAAWLDGQHASLSFGLKTVADAEKLYDYWQGHLETVPQRADQESAIEGTDVGAHRIRAIGYDPLCQAVSYRHKQSGHQVETGDDTAVRIQFYGDEGSPQYMLHEDFHATYDLVSATFDRRSRAAPAHPRPEPASSAIECTLSGGALSCAR
jgi:hypothetical protein